MRTAGRHFASTLHDCARALVDFAAEELLKSLSETVEQLTDMVDICKPAVTQEREIQDAILTRMQIRSLDVIVLLFLRTRN